MGFPPWSCPVCNGTEFHYNKLNISSNKDECEIYATPFKKHMLAIPCKTCGQDFEVEHRTNKNGTFKIGKFVNCKECIKEKKQ